MTTLEDRISGELKWNSVSKIDKFPLKNFEEVKEKVKNKEYILGIDYTISNQLSQWIFGSSYRAFFLLCASAPIINAVIFVILSFVLGNWWLLFGVILGFIGQFFSNPYNPSRGLFKTIASFAIMVALFSFLVGNIMIALLCVAYFVPFFINSYIYYHNQDKIKEVVLKSEPIFIYLYQIRGLGLLNKITDESFWYFERSRD